MKLNDRHKIFCRLLPGCIVLLTFLNNVKGNPELDHFVKKYPEEHIISNEHNLDITFIMKNNKPLAVTNRISSYFILSGNASDYADSKEYFSSSSSFKKLIAYTLIPRNEKYKKLPVQEYTKTTEIGNSLFYDDTYAMNFSFPSVCVGAKIVTESSFESDELYLPFVFYFAGNIPYDSSNLEITVPADINIRYHLEGGRDTSLIKFSKETDGKNSFYHWHSSMTKCYHEDRLAPNFRYFTPHIVIQIASYKIKEKVHPVITSIKDYYKYYYSRIKKINELPSRPIIKLADSITKSYLSNEEKVDHLFKWVQNNIKYVAIEDGNHGIIPQDAEDVLKNRYGDCKGKTSLLVELIRAVDLNSSFAWLGSRNLPYKYSIFPTSNVDDHMIAVWWNDAKQPVVLDATSLYNQIYDIPAFIQGKECLISRNDTDFSIYTIPVAGAQKNMFFDSLSIRLENNTIFGTGKLRLTGEQMVTFKDAIESMEKSNYYKLISNDNIKASNKFLIDSVSVIKGTKDCMPYELDYSFYLPDYVSKNEDYIYLNMNIDRFLQKLNFNETRDVPIESEFCTQYKLVCCFDIPAGYKVESLPQPKSVTTDKFEFRQEYLINKNCIVLNSEVLVKFLLLESEDLKLFRENLKSMNNNYIKTIKLIKI